MRTFDIESVPTIILMWREQYHPGVPIERVRAKYERQLRTLMFSPACLDDLREKADDWLHAKHPEEIAVLFAEYNGLWG